MPTVLIVDDNPGDVDLMRDAFAELGLGVTLAVAGNGEDALVLLDAIDAGRAERPALIILDLNMPGITGREVLARVRGGTAVAAIPTVILTSSSSPVDRAECLAKGADAFFTKPNTLDRLEALARELQALIAKGPQTRHFVKRPPGGAAGLARLVTAVYRMLVPRSPDAAAIDR